MIRDGRLAELFELCEALCRDELSADQQDRLQALVKADAELRTAYVRYLHMHVCLRRAFEGNGGVTMPVCPPVEPEAADEPHVVSVEAARPRFMALRMLAAASVLLAVGLGISTLWVHRAAREVVTPRPATPAAPDCVATLTNAVGCAWGLPERPLKGTPLRAGRVELNAGMAEFTFADQTVVLVEAPAVIELVGPSRAYLHSGRVVAKVPHPATGFVIETARASVLDLGTEFGVGVGDSGDTLVQVFEGRVVADFKSTGGVAQRRLDAGQTVHVGGGDEDRPRDLVSSEQRFVRRMPPAKERGRDELVPYNRHRFDAMHIVPAAKAPTIDGDLSDWDLSGAFFCPCEEPFAKDYYVKGAMMYDKDFVYIAAHVGDPEPMCSVIDPATDPTLGWKGGGVQVRLSTDKGLGWPIDAANGLGLNKRRGPLPQDNSPRLAHLTMWYCKPKDLPCLHIAYGMDFRKDVTNPAGARGVFRKDKDGRGYTLEYAVPWRLLNAEADPPRGGDVLGCTWNVHWSDEEGRLWRGYLVDVLNPNEKGFTYWSAGTWGRAVYHDKGKLPPGAVSPR